MCLHSCSVYDKHKIIFCFSNKTSQRWFGLACLLYCRTQNIVFFALLLRIRILHTLNRSKLCRVNLSHLRSSLKLVFPFWSPFSIKFHILFIIIIISRLWRCCRRVFALSNWITNILYYRNKFAIVCLSLVFECRNKNGKTMWRIEIFCSSSMTTKHQFCRLTNAWLRFSKL